MIISMTNQGCQTKMCNHQTEHRFLFDPKFKMYFQLEKTIIQWGSELLSSLIFRSWTSIHHSDVLVIQMLGMA